MNSTYDPKYTEHHLRLFADQMFNKYLFEGAEDEYAKSFNDYLTKTSRIHFAPEDFFSVEEHTIQEMGSTPYALQFLIFLGSLINPKVVVEIGSFVGFSTCNMAAALPTAQRIIALDAPEKFINTAKANAKKFSVDERIEFIHGDAISALSSQKIFNTEVDFVFIDGNKENYLWFVKFFEERISKGGVIVVDDCFFHGDVFNKNVKTKKGLGALECIEYLTKSEKWNTSLLPISNGIALAKRI